ncbi:hypothetical protein EG68_01486 [Paragonimus skrjabini miyazakii]|uniref:Uncharacterized protein n=1 Tax=Paragonimus skrjabini miyazakii TaxID=59628 RepID=A0A8S9ZAJ0_9TREM|nr:hypothetical protein EG68_01486 [Paragonimus skrjabini miyazakii]
MEDSYLMLWKSKISLYLSTVPVEHQRAVISSCLNDRVHEILMSINVSVASSLEEVWEKLFAFFSSAGNLALAKDWFGNTKLLIDESVDQFANDLRVLSSKAFPTNTPQERESFILQRFTSGIGNVIAREFIRKEP